MKQLSIFLSQNQNTTPEVDGMLATDGRRSGKNGSRRMRCERAPSEAISEQTELFDKLPKQATPLTLEQVLRQKVFADYWDYQTTLVSWNP